MILKDTEVTGELLMISGDLLLMGKVSGNIQCSGRVVINEEASVSGNILCDILDVSGTVAGKVKTTLLTLREQGTIRGEVETTRLRICGENIGISTLRLVHN
ncbi:MAG: polymer-forming cytoskeletal protein [Odoribacteraceae bacterium]|nr:polymer-forming cytoskeletal protein [Odoribacteraceae bacterium]